MIRLPEIPDLQQTAIRMPEMSGKFPQAAALGNLAKSIGNVGEAFAAHAEKIDRVDQAEKESTFRNKLREDYATFNLELDKEQDPAARIKKTQDWLSTYKGSLDAPDLSPETRQRLGQHYDDFATSARINSAQDAARLTVQRASLALNNEMESAMQSGDRAGFQDALSRTEASIGLLPEKRALLEQNFEKTVRHNESLAEIAHDPNAWLEANPADKPAPGYDMGSWSNLQSHAKQQLRSVTYDITGKIQDGIVSGKISTPEQIDQLTPELRPAARAELKTTLWQQLSAADKAARATPEYQAQTVGKVSALLTDYTPTSDSFDSDFVKIDALTRTLPPGAVRDELERRVKDVRDGKQTEIKTHADSAMAALDSAYKSGAFGKPPENEDQSVSRILNAGFLNDRAKLLSLGLQPAQVDSVINARNPKGDKTPAAQLAAFRALSSIWPNRDKQVPSFIVTADPFTLEAAEAILNGDEKVKYQSPESVRASAIAKVEAQMKFGRAKTELANWIKINPKATATEIDDQVFKIAGAETRSKLQSGLFDPRPTMTPASAGDRITSFGYANDSTPDTNSAAGIGAFVSAEEAQRIKNGEDTPNKLKAGDISISRDIEAQFKEAGIQPKQTVTLKLADGSTHTGRWNDRTAVTYDGRSLTGRFDIYSPDGPSKMNGSRVIGWEPAK
jgi:hypothetical protein